MEQEEKKRYNPFRVMIDPRGFMRKELPTKFSSGWWIALVVGIVWLFTEANTFSLGYEIRLWGILLFCIVSAIPIGYLILYVFSLLLYGIGKIFDGKATFNQVYRAFLWSRVPELFNFLSWAILIGIYGREVFTPSVMYSGPIPYVVMILITLQVIFSVWETIILFHTLGEVQGFSAWIAVWNVLFVWIILMLVEGTFQWIVAKGLVWTPLAIKSLMHL